MTRISLITWPRGAASFLLNYKGHLGARTVIVLGHGAIIPRLQALPHGERQGDSKDALRAGWDGPQRRGGGNPGSATEMELLELAETAAKAMIRQKTQRCQVVELLEQGPQATALGQTIRGFNPNSLSSPSFIFGNSRTSLRVFETYGALVR